MKRTQRILSAPVAVASLAILLAAAAPTASAEIALDVYAGIAITNDAGLDGTVGGAPTLGRDIAFQDSVSTGIRGAWWLGGDWAWLGVGFDVGYFGAYRDGSPGVGIEVDRFHVVPITPLLMLRAPLFRDEQYTSGRIQPYVAAGPSVIVTMLTESTSGALEASADIGLDYRVGFTALVRPRWGLFAEYRLTDSIVHTTSALGDDVKTRLQTDHALFGVTYRFE